MRFQVLFHSPHRGTFHLSLAVLYAIGRWQIFSLGRWSSQIPTGFLVPCGTRGQAHAVSTFVYGGITLYAGTFQTLRLADSVAYGRPTTPEVRVPLVWAVPLSLATTRGISFDFFSSGY